MENRSCHAFVDSYTKLLRMCTHPSSCRFATRTPHHTGAILFNQSQCLSFFSAFTIVHQLSLFCGVFLSFIFTGLTRFVSHRSLACEFLSLTACDCFVVAVPTTCPCRVLRVMDHHVVLFCNDSDVARRESVCCSFSRPRKTSFAPESLSIFSIFSFTSSSL